MILRTALAGLALAAAVAGDAAIGQTPPADPAAPPPSAGVYRLPYADGTPVGIFDDITTHRPIGRIDFTAEPAGAQHRVVAAADGWIAAIQDGYAEQQSGRAAKDCRNNYVWIRHANGEWSNYSHIRTGSATHEARLKVGARVHAGQFIGYEGAVGCAMLQHVHFEVIAPAPGQAIDDGGFALDNAANQRERRPLFCGVDGGQVVKGGHYVAAPCRSVGNPDRD